MSAVALRRTENTQQAYPPQEIECHWKFKGVGGGIRDYRSMGIFWNNTYPHQAVSQF